MVESELKDEVATVEREFKLRKRITVLFERLHLTWGVNNLG